MTPCYTSQISPAAVPLPLSSLSHRKSHQCAILLINYLLTMSCVKHLAASRSLFRFLSSKPLCRRYFYLRMTSGIIGASSLPSFISRMLPFSKKLIRHRVDSRTFSAVNIFLLFKFAKAQQIVILIIRSMNRGCFLEGKSALMGTRMLL